jgi:hypothetical protein
MTRPPADLGRSERGAVAILAAFLILVVVGFVSLGTEIVMLLSAARSMQGAADAGALAAVEAQIAGYPADYRQDAYALAAAAGFSAAAHGCADTPTVYVGAPCAGPYAGSADYTEALIRQPVSLPLAGMFYAGGFVPHGRALARATGFDCLIALDGTANSALSMNGTTAANLVNCSAAVDSTSGQALSLVGGATINAQYVDVAGGVQLSGGSQVNAVLTTNANRTRDPYEGTPVPSVGACDKTGFNPPASTTITNPHPLSPFVFCKGITLNAGVALTLGPGIYVVDGGQLSMAGGASLTGSGVTIVLSSKNVAGYATVKVAGGANLNLTAPASGPTAGLAFFQDPAAPQSGSNSFNGGSGQTIIGALYFPNQALSYAGGGTASNCTQIVARTIAIAGNATLALDDAACAGAGVKLAGGHPVLVE